MTSKLNEGKRHQNDPEKKAALAIRHAVAPLAPHLDRWMEVPKLKTEDQYSESNALLAEIKAELKKANDKRLEYVQPLKRVAAKIDKEHKTTTAPFRDLVDHLSKLGSDWVLAIEAKERKKLERRAKNAEKRGDEQYAENIRDQKEMVRANASTESTLAVRRWSAEVTNLAALVKAIAAGKVPLKAIEANTSYLNSIAKATKAEDLGMPGVKGVCRVDFDRRGSR